MSTDKTVIVSAGGAGADNELRETQPATHIPDQPGFGDDLDSLAQMLEDGMQYIDHTLFGQIVPLPDHPHYDDFKVTQATKQGSHMQYTVEGYSDANALFSVQRRYNDF